MIPFSQKSGQNVLNKKLVDTNSMKKIAHSCELRLMASWVVAENAIDFRLCLSDTFISHVLIQQNVINQVSGVSLRLFCCV